MTPPLVYSDEAVRLYHGDALDVLATMESVDHVITDPPYARDVYVRASMPNTKVGSGTPGRLAPSGNNHAHPNTTPRVSIAKLAAGDIGCIDEILEDCAAHFARIVRRWAIVFSDAETTHLWRGALVAGGTRYIRTGAWAKPDPMPQFSGDRPAVGFEPATICHAQGPMRWNGGGGAALWMYGTCKSDRPDHPCPKPLDLMLRLVRDFTDVGETVLDCFAGSGTTGVACKRLGRKCVLVERDEKFCELIARRLAATEPDESYRFGARKAKQQSLDLEGDDAA